MRLVVLSAWMAVLAVTTACKASDATVVQPTDASVVGFYNLALVNGGPLPFPYSASATYRIDIVSGSLTLTSDHAFADLLTTRQTFFAGGSGPDRTETLQGSWSLQGTNLTLTYPGIAAQLAIVTANQISINSQGLALRYDK